MMSVELMPTVTRTMHIGSFMSISAIFGFAAYVLEELMVSFWFDDQWLINGI